MSFRPWFSSLSCQNYKYSVANIFFHYYFSRPVLFLLFFSVNSSYRLVLHLIIKYNLINLLTKENKMILPCKLGRRLLLILKKTHYTWGVFQNVFFRNIRFFFKKKVPTAPHFVCGEQSFESLKKLISHYHFSCLSLSIVTQKKLTRRSVYFRIMSVYSFPLKLFHKKETTVITST